MEKYGKEFFFFYNNRGTCAAGVLYLLKFRFFEIQN
jgi:hypothetical protein